MHVQVEDGIPCGSSSGLQCFESDCVESQDLNPYNTWITDWANCYDCDDVQLSITWCRGQNADTGATYGVDSLLCSPPDPISSRMCQNTSIGCVTSDDNALLSSARDLYNTYDAISKASWLRSLIPRVCGPDELVIVPPEGMDPTGEIQDDFEEYWPCTGYTAILGLGLFVLGIIYACCHFICCIRTRWCCAENKKPNYYSKSGIPHSKYILPYTLIPLKSVTILRAHNPILCYCMTHCFL